MISFRYCFFYIRMQRRKSIRFKIGIVLLITLGFIILTPPENINYFSRSINGKRNTIVKATGIFDDEVWVWTKQILVLRSGLKTTTRPEKTHLVSFRVGWRWKDDTAFILNLRWQCLSSRLAQSFFFSRIPERELGVHFQIILEKMKIDKFHTFFQDFTEAKLCAIQNIHVKSNKNAISTIA